AINASGQVAGYSASASGRDHATLFSNGAALDLGTLAGPAGFSYAEGINGAGQVVGRSTTPSSNAHAFLYQNGQMLDLGALGPFMGSDTSSATAISNRGQVVGFSTAVDSPTHAFLYSDGQMVDLGTLGGLRSRALAVNDLGQVVGDSESAGGANR